jgi:hypothetical protein
MSNLTQTISPLSPFMYVLGLVFSIALRVVSSKLSLNLFLTKGGFTWQY